MHVLILNVHSIQATFIQRGLRYENIGADICQPQNLAQIWYGQYDALVIPLHSWDVSTFIDIQSKRKQLGNIPTLFTSKTLPPKPIRHEIEHDPLMHFMGSHIPFHTICETLKELIHDYKGDNASSRKIEIADIRIDLKTHRVERQKNLILLRNREFTLLACLMRNVNRVLTRTFLLENVWDRNTSILSNTVDVHISRLRRKIDDGFEQKRILTIPCIGYKLLGKPQNDSAK
jgi:DNA-binding winged helix-turn-helix (wHTH) protein